MSFRLVPLKPSAAKCRMATARIWAFVPPPSGSGAPIVLVISVLSGPRHGDTAGDLRRDEYPSAIGWRPAEPRVERGCGESPPVSRSVRLRPASSTDQSVE